MSNTQHIKKGDHMENLTVKEQDALFELILVCLDGMGGNHPKDLFDDFYTWVEPKDLVGKSSENFTINQARGLFSSMERKGLIDSEFNGPDQEWSLTEDAVNIAVIKWD